eukprot:6239347-Pyramimonas_sp.AAC.1
MRADPMTKGRVSRELVLSIVDDRFGYDRHVAKLSEEKLKKAVPSSQRSTLANKENDDATGSTT